MPYKTILKLLFIFLFIVCEINLHAFDYAKMLSEAATEQTYKTVRYDPTYVKIPYPNGDVPADTGVCADVIIRAYRTSHQIDLQKLVHEDMLQNFSVYPKTWGLKSPDKNIDHRRVLNLRKFFERKGSSLSLSKENKDYLPGDIISWIIPGNLPHIGMVVDQKSHLGTPLIVHNIGQGAQVEDVLFSFKMTGHYRYR